MCEAGERDRRGERVRGGKDGNLNTISFIGNKIYTSTEDFPELLHAKL